MDIEYTSDGILLFETSIERILLGIRQNGSSKRLTFSEPELTLRPIVGDAWLF